MAESLSTFEGGMSSDNSPLYQQPKTYVEALNIELLNDEIQGSISISNSKGNKFQQSLPDVSAIYRLSIVNPVVSTLVDITINGITSATSLFVTSTTTIEDLYEFIINDANFNLSNISIYYDTTKVILVSDDSSSLLVTVTDNTIILGGDTSAGGVGPYVPAQSNLQPIGYGIINDDIYIFSTNSTDTDPQTNGGGYGQIWKLTYDNINFDASLSTITLIYSADLSFTTYYHIPQTGVVTRYENSTIQRIYWTDNYNRVRNINVADPNVFTTDLSLLELISAVDFDVPILTEIQPGGSASLNVGVYQLAYRLKNTAGTETCYSPLSNMVSVTDRDERIAVLGGADNFADYCGAAQGTTTTKIISWTINNIDIDYDRIEAVILIREQYNEIPTIYSFYEDNISGRTSMTISFSGDDIDADDTFQVTLAEFLTLSGYFTHAKTLATKDNSLIAGNLRTASLDLSFDTRAYRFSSTPGSPATFDIIENGVTNQYNVANWETIDEESDAINPNQNTFRYKSDGVTLGGEGPNISYEFVSVAIESDTGDGSTASTSLDIGAQQIYPFRKTSNDVAPFTTELNLNVYSSDENAVDVLQEYPLALPQTTYEDVKYPQYNGMFWGYQQNEIYRIGIQFYDKAKNPYFTKWIGDIKFPDINDTCPAANNIYQDGTQTGQTTYVKSFVALRAGKPYAAYITQLGLKVDITIPADLTELISGYSIVRVERTDADKSVVAEGIITSVGDNSSPNEYYTPDPTIGGNNEFIYQYVNAERAVCYFNTPNHIVSGITEPRIGDVLNVRKAFQVANAATSTQLGGSGDPYYLFKLYNEISTATSSHSVTQVLNLGIGQDGTAANNYVVNNNDNTAHSEGNQCYFFSLGSSLSLSNYAGSNFKLYATIDRTLNSQYGGNTYADRSANEYILCSHFRSVKTNTNGYSDSSYIFGGDVLNYHVDMQRCIKKWDGGSAPLVSTTFYFPAASCANIGFRTGTFINRSLQADDGTGASGTETYDYNEVYSSTNNIVKFFPKPDPFIENTEYNNRFRISEIKINGELSDSWRIFKENNYWDVEGDKGPINSSLVMADKLYFWQSRAFGIMQVFPRAVIQDINATSLQVGTGLPLQRHDYISTTVGTRHQSSTISSDRKLYWYDTNTRKIYTYSQEGVKPFSDIKGLYAYLNNNLDGEIQNVDKPLYADILIGVNGIAATYDYKRHKAIFTFNSGKDLGREDLEQKSFTVAINELNDTFLSFYSYKPRMYINDYKYIFSPNYTSNTTISDIYIHDIYNYCLFYDSLYTTYIKFIINDAPQYTKIFDNLTFDVQSKNGIINIHDDFWNVIRITNDYQNTDSITLTYPTNIKRRERSWNLAIPRNRVLYTANNSPNIYTDLSPTPKPFGERIRDKYIQVELTYNNLSNYELLTNNIRSIFRQSDR